MSEAIAKANPDDAQAIHELSAFHERLGDLHLRLGAAGRALASFQKSLESNEALVKANPNDASAKRDLALSYGRAGAAYEELGSIDKATRIPSAVRRAEHGEPPGPRPMRQAAKHDLWIGYYKLGQVHMRLGSTQKALECFQNALVLSEAIARLKPNDGLATRELATSYNRLGDVHLQMGLTQKAAPVLRGRRETQ